MSLDKFRYIQKRKSDYYKEKYKREKKKDIILKKQIKLYASLAKDDVMYRILNSLATRAREALNKVGVERNYSHTELIGCSIEELRQQLSKQFTDGMSFDNYGEWEIDHIKPVSSFDFRNDHEILNCFNHKNLQPLWLPDNRSKGAFYP